MLFTLSIAIFCLIGASSGSIDKYLGCQSPIKGIYNKWMMMDNLIALADQTTCTSDCPCKISGKTEDKYKEDPVAKPIYLKYYSTVTDNSKKNKNFKDCKSKFNEEKNNIFNYFDNQIKLTSVDNFAKYWKYIEEKFDCVGWCTTSAKAKYINTGNTNSKRITVDTDLISKLDISPNQVPFMKYIFSDMDRGIPKHRGCMGQVLKYVPKMLKSFGSFSLFIGVLQVILTALLIKIIKNHYGENKEQKTVEGNGENNENKNENKNENNI